MRSRVASLRVMIWWVRRLLSFSTMSPFSTSTRLQPPVSLVVKVQKSSQLRHNHRCPWLAEYVPPSSRSATGRHSPTVEPICVSPTTTTAVLSVDPKVPQDGRYDHAYPSHYPADPVAPLQFFHAFVHAVNSAPVVVQSLVVDTLPDLDHADALGELGQVAPCRPCFLSQRIHLLPQHGQRDP